MDTGYTEATIKKRKGDSVSAIPELAAQFSVMSIPTLAIVKDGKIVARRTGVTPKEMLLPMLDGIRV